MATTVDTLLVRIEADMSDLKRDLARVAKTTEATGQRMEGAFRKVGRAIAALGGAYVFGNFIKSTIQTGAEIEGLRVQLDALLGSAEQGGKAFDQMAEFAGRVPFSLAEIQAGSGSLAAASDNADELGELLQVTGNIAAQFGIPFNEAAANVQRALSAGIGSADLFRDKGVTAFAGFEAGVTYSAGETAKKLLENFGTGGTADGAMDAFAKTTAGVVSMFGDAMHRMRGNIAQSGLNEGFRDLVRAITDVTNASGPLAQAIGQALGNAFSFLADTIRLLQKAFAALSAPIQNLLRLGREIQKILSEAFGPYVIVAMDTVQRMITLVKDNMGLLLTVAGAYLSINMAKALHNQAIAAYKFATATLASGKAFRFLNGVIKKSPVFLIAAALGMIGEQFGLVDDLVAKLEKGFDELIPPHVMEMLKDTGASFTQAAQDIAKAREEIFGAGSGQAFEPETQYPAGQAAAAVSAIQEALASAGASGSSLKELSKIINANISPVHQLKQEYNILKTAMDAVGDRAGPKLKEAFKNVSEQLQQAVFQMKLDANPAFAALVDGATALGDGITSAFRKMLDGTKVTMNDFKDMLKATVADVIAQIFRLTVVNQVLNAIFPGLGLQTSTFSQILGRASGGAIQANQPYLVGERGPELIVPNTGATVLNNHNTRNALGGGGGVMVNQTINVDAGVSQTVRAEMLSLLPRFKQDTMAAVVDAKRRGGSFGQAFG